MKKLTESVLGGLDLVLKPSSKMKMTYFLVLISFFQIHANVYSQKKKISLNMKNSTIKDVFSVIESKTDYNFLYNLKDVDLDRRVSINVQNQQLEKVLKSLFKNTNVDYSIVDKQIILKLLDKKNSNKSK